MFISKEDFTRITRNRDEAWAEVDKLRKEIEEAKPKVACVNCHVLTSSIPSKNRKYCSSCQYQAQQMILIA